MALSPVARLADTLLDRTVVPGFTKIGIAARRRLPGWPDDPQPGALQGRRVIVTGASSGLGEATALGCLRLGADVDLVVRDADKGDRSRRRLLSQADTGADTGAERVRAEQVRVVRCDLADLEDVTRCAEALAQGPGPIHALVHNAGALPAERTESPQGHEQTMALHVLGPVLLTDRMRSSLAEDARIVMVTSGGMYAQRLRADDPEFVKGDYSGTAAYARSKRAQVDLLPILQRRWAPAQVHAMHPGWADTPGVTTSLPTFSKVVGPLLRDPEQGSDTSVWLCSAQPAPSGGRLWHDRRPRPTHMWGRNATTPDEIDRLWAWVCEETGLAP